MTNAPTPNAAGVATDTAPPLASVTYDFKGSVKYSMIKGLPAFESDDYYEQFFKDYIRVLAIRDRMLGGHMVEEAVAAGAVINQQASQNPLPATAYANPQGEFVNPNPAPSAPPVQQPPVAAPQGAQNGPQQGSALTIVYVHDDQGNMVPACSMHKTNTGTPRPFRHFEANNMGPAVWKCTAKKKDGSYCTNSVEPD